MNTFKKIAFLALISLGLKASAQTDKATTGRIVAEKNFIFVATSAMPMNSTEVNNILRQMPGGNASGNINLASGNYDVRITADSIVSFLPYYGRSYSAPVNRDDSGFKFTSKDFTYTVSKRKRGGWDVDIVAKDTRDNTRMNLNIGTDGYAALTVTSMNKQSISYNGYLSEPKKKPAN